MKTPQLSYPPLAQALGHTNDVWLKREDLHHYGSHKGRSIPLMMREYIKRGARQFVISSSGNAALVAVLVTAEYNRNHATDPIALTVYTGPNMDSAKLARLTQAARGQTSIKLVASERPKQAALQKAKTGAAVNLRQSTDALSTLGYHELAEEIAKIPNLAAVFIPTSSGTTAAGLYEGFEMLGLNPEIHIIQTQACHPMVDYLTRATETLSIGPSLASAIVDKVAFRKETIAAIIQKTNGAGWMIANNEILAAQALVKETCGLEISPNSALSVAGLTQAIKTGRRFGGPVVCLITGE